MNDPIVIVGAKRTPMGSFLGALSTVPAPVLGSYAIQAALSESNLNPTDVTDVLMGCVLPAGLGQAPARQAALKANLPYDVTCTTVNKVCGSGMRTVMLGCDSLLTNNADVVVAGGMENMSLAPYILSKARHGYRLGHDKILDHMIYDGLQDAYEEGCLMGHFADRSADIFNVSREDQDQFAIASFKRAHAAQKKEIFKKEITPVQVSLKKETVTIEEDELPTEEKRAKIPHLKPAFGEKGTVTAANASSITDGAAALILTRQSYAHEKGLKVKAIIKGYTSHAQEPSLFTTAPVNALRKLAKKVNWPLETVDLFEINEAFALVVLLTMRELSLPLEKVNIHGGACVLGHPIGASGARILVTLLNALEQTRKTKGMATLCIGGGEATAIAIERV